MPAQTGTFRIGGMTPQSRRTFLNFKEVSMARRGNSNTRRPKGGDISTKPSASGTVAGWLGFILKKEANLLTTQFTLTFCLKVRNQTRWSLAAFWVMATNALPNLVQLAMAFVLAGSKPSIGMVMDSPIYCWVARGEV